MIDISTSFAEILQRYMAILFPYRQNISNTYKCLIANFADNMIY